MIRFACKSCKTELVLPEAQGEISGPCPKCGSWIDSSSISPSTDKAVTLNAALPAQSVKKKRCSQTVTSGKGRVRADGYLDHDYNDQRELVKTLRLVSICLTVIAVIFFVSLYMKQWLAQ
ncbi:MAG: hypothetical protein ACSHX7_03150 [Luteolibacter sp.]